MKERIICSQDMYNQAKLALELYLEKKFYNFSIIPTHLIPVITVDKKMPPGTLKLSKEIFGGAKKFVKQFKELGIF